MPLGRLIARRIVCCTAARRPPSSKLPAVPTPSEPQSSFSQLFSLTSAHAFSPLNSCRQVLNAAVVARLALTKAGAVLGGGQLAPCA